MTSRIPRPILGLPIRSHSARKPARLAAALAAGLLLAACSNEPEPPQAGATTAAPTFTTPTTTAAPATTAPASGGPLKDVRLRLARVVTAEEPVAMAAPRGEAAIYLVEKVGRVRALRGGRLDPTPVLDLTGKVALGGEQGLLGLAFSLDRRFLYVYYTDLDGDIRIVEYGMRGGRADPGSRRELLSVEHSQFGNHNGGQLVVAPDGTLWAGIGDGGSGGDPNGNGQNLGVLLGKILRIDPRAAGGRPYRIPPDNPFVGRAGARPEIWAYGLRNPWRYSFDRSTGDLWIGDVGQSAWEEVDFLAAGSGRGANLGWARLEGNHPFKGAAPPGAVGPIYEYRTSDGCAVTGGYVYRGTRIPGLTGAYLFGDFCNGRIMGMRQRDGARVELQDLGLEVSNLESFGQGPDGELYAFSLDGNAARIDPA